MADFKTEKKISKGYEIDLMEVFQNLWINRKTIYLSVSGFFVLGIIIVLGTPKKYESEVTLLVESTSSVSGMGGLLQQFGGLAGVNLSAGLAGTDVLSPQLYPDVIKSTPFLLDIMKLKVTESKYDSTLSVADYLKHHTKTSITGVLMSYTLGLPSKIINWAKGKPKEPKLNGANQQQEYLKLTQEQFDIAEALSGIIKSKQNKTDNKLVISVEVQDPYVAGELTDSVVKMLTKYVVNYRTQKAKNILEFVTLRSEEAEKRYITAQQALATHRDQNKNVILASVRTEEERLQSEYNLAFNLYNSLSQQLEQAKLKLQQDTPVFTVLDPAQVPIKKSGPQTILILIVCMMLGGLLGIGIIYKKLIFKPYSNAVN